MTPDALRNALRGITAIAVTPMDDRGGLDLPGLKRHLRYLVDSGIDSGNGVVVLTGSTGECGALTPDEREQVWRAGIEELGGELPVIAGCNHSNIEEVKDLLGRAERVGAAGAMILSPYYYVPTAEVVVDFYREVSDSTSLGLMLYNNTEVTHYDIPVEVLRQVAVSSSVVGIKECTPNFVKMERTARELGSLLTVVNGHGEFLEPYAALAGTRGFISSTSNFAARYAVEVWEARSKGDYAGAVKVRERLTPYLDLAAELGALGGEPKVLSLIKYLAHRVTGISTRGRLPLLPLNANEIERADKVLSDLDLV